MMRTPTEEITKISVRNLVEFILRGGDIDNRRAGMPDKDAMQLGSRLHRKIQGGMGEDYQAEVFLSRDFPCDDFFIRVEGRADGIVAPAGDEPALIDEIKGILRPVERLEEPVPVHLAQAKCYAYLYSLEHDLSRVRVRMSYANLETYEMKYFHFIYTLPELAAWFETLLEEYKKWARFQREWRKIRQASIRSLAFPFPYRDGQKDLVRDVYLTILRRKQLFIQAPTGVGKTLSTVFPSVKAVGEELADKIFYLTARTITRTAANAAFDLLRDSGLRFKTVILTAKEKICPLEETVCNPDACPCAKGHFDRVNNAVFEMLGSADVFDREGILAGAQHYNVCPFELSLDLASWVDGIIGDYNYAFHPRARLKRFFGEGVKGEYIFLVDEAHNLVDRGRDMYSAAIVKEDLLALNRQVKGLYPRLSKALLRVNQALLEMKKELAQTQKRWQIRDGVGTLPLPVMSLYGILDDLLHDEHHPVADPLRSELLDLYFLLGTFLDTVDLLDESYVVYTEDLPGSRFMLRLWCVNPRTNLGKCFEKGRASALFSATLLPIDYFKGMLSAAPDSYAVYASSCFDTDRMRVLSGTDVSTKYTRRDEISFRRIADYILKMVSARQGNYMVFFPSYRMMRDVAACFEIICPPHVRLLLQDENMDETAREAFLEAFTADGGESLTGFCVMGSIFGEGIDLRGERLIGAMIVGPGLPMVCSEQEILKAYFTRRGQDGFRLAYQCPGMNKVMQAAGRVIRTEEDRGVIILLDERFGQARYRQMFPREWKDMRLCRLDNVDALLRAFWTDPSAAPASQNRTSTTSDT